MTLQARLGSIDFNFFAQLSMKCMLKLINAIAFLLTQLIRQKKRRREIALNFRILYRNMYLHLDEDSYMKHK
jgi:hypothetical protein